MAHLLIWRQLYALPRQRIVATLQYQQQLHKSTQPQWQKAKSSLALEEATARSELSEEVRPLGEKIKENTKTVSYTAIIVAGIGVTGIMFYAIFRELFSSFSPNNVYSEALERVKEDPRVQDVLGCPIKGFGEESRRGRRQHVAHSLFDRNGVPHMRMQFYVQGIRNRATVHVESRKLPSGKMEYRYLFVQLDYHPYGTIILEDNRAFDPVDSKSQPDPSPMGLSNLQLTSFDSKK